MANKSLFASTPGKMLPRPDCRNREGALSYEYTPEHKLAQYAVSGCFSGTFYADAQQQLDDVMELCGVLAPAFIAKTAIYCRKQGYMKDMPAFLTAALTLVGPNELAPTFRQVVDNGKMLRNFVQIMRSGAVGRKSLGSRPKALVQDWLNRSSDDRLIRAAVGQSPSLADVIKMVHPRPANPAREALYGYFLGQAHDARLLPDSLKLFERFKQNRSGEVPPVPFQMLTALNLSASQWAQIARKAGWQMTRMNLNTFARHGVFKLDGMAEAIAERLRDPSEIARAKVFPYQIMIAQAMAGAAIPAIVREALHDAMEISLENIPAMSARIAVCPDVSGSMSSPVTGHRRGATSIVRCIDVAALIAAACLRRAPAAWVLPFEHRVVGVDLDPRDSILTNARKLGAVGGGGTNCSAPLAMLNHERAEVDLVVMVSDNQSWVDATCRQDTGTLREWNKLKARNPSARLVCIDLQPYGSTQAPDRGDVLNVGGFSDAVFRVLNDFARGEMGPDHWIGEIEKVSLAA